MGTWIVEFQQLWEVGVFSYLVSYCLKSHENGLFWSCEAENGHVFRSQRNETDYLMRGLSMDSPRLDLGLFKIVQNLFWTKSVHVKLLDVIAENENGEMNGTETGSGDV